MKIIMYLWWIAFLVIPFHLHAEEEPSEENQERFSIDFAVCAVFQNEGPYLKEWIEFHKLVGAQRFYLYNNLSTDNFEEILTPYIESGDVVLIDWPYKQKPGDRSWMPIQWRAHTDCVKQARKDKVRWIAFMDLDEYLFPVEGELMIDTLSKFERKGIGGIAVNWQLYGTSFVKNLPKDQLMIEVLRYKARRTYHENSQSKAVVRPKYTTSCRDSHTMHYVKGYRCITEKGERVTGLRTPSVSVKKLRINHYWTRDENYFFNTKIQRRREHVHKNEKISQLEQRAAICNEQYDEEAIILKYAPKLREKLGLQEIKNDKDTL